MVRTVPFRGTIVGALKPAPATIPILLAVNRGIRQLHIIIMAQAYAMTLKGEAQMLYHIAILLRRTQGLLAQISETYASITF